MTALDLPAHQFLAMYVFEAAGGARHPARATILTFVTSGVIHEYLFGIAMALPLYAQRST